MYYLIVYFTLLLVFISGCTNKEITKNDCNIVLITIDTLRADHLSCYGYERKVSPNIDKVAEKGILFKNVIAPSSWTAPSMVSLFTSTYPINHGVIHGFGVRRKRRERQQYSQEVFSDALATLPEMLKNQGYTTFGVSSNHNLTADFGFARGFDYFRFIYWKSADLINEIVYSWEDKINKAGKFFLWVHYIDPHYPYYPQSPWIEQYLPENSTDIKQLIRMPQIEMPPNIAKTPGMLSTILALYDSEINYVDSYVGELIERLDLDKNSLLIITSDHGEQFFERGKIGHPFNLHSEVLNVPLIIKLPETLEMETIENQASLIDIMPTISHILDTDPPKQTRGKSLLKHKGLFKWLKTTLFRRKGSRHIFAELDTKSTLKAIISSDWKYIYNLKKQTQQLYNIISDPNELTNLSDKKALQRDQLKKQLLNWVSNSRTYPVESQSFELSQEEKEKLEAMGYIATEENKDYDNDGISNAQDNCPNIPNQDQEDTDKNGIGNKCEPSMLEYQWLEAEHADTIVNPLEVANDDSASNSRFIYAPNGTGNDYSAGFIMSTYTVNISQEGEYILLGRVKVTDKRDNSFFVQIDNGLNNLWEVETGDSWHWDRVNDRDILDPVKFILKSGVHKLKIKLREDGTKLDKLLLTNNVDFVPLGKGGFVENQDYSQGR